MKVAAVLYVPDTQEVLCGLESYYCFEESDNIVENQRLHQYEYDTEEHAIQHAIRLSNLFQREIRYSEFQNSRTHFCCLTTNSHMGIIKGSSIDNETAVTAIQREISEEVGIIIPEERLQSTLSLPNVKLYTTIYMIPLTNIEKTEIERQIEERKKRHCGELFHMQFRILPDITHPMNYITRMVCQWLQKNKLDDYTTKQVSFPIRYTPLLPFDNQQNQYYDISFLPEQPFVWGKKRISLLPLPMQLEII